MRTSTRAIATRLGPALALALTSLAAACVLVDSPAAAETPDTLPLGDADLVETRSTQVLERGVTLTRIVRGTEPAPPDEINTTTRGPWVVNVLTIDPRLARGNLRATYGPDIAQVEKTTDLVHSYRRKQE